MLTTYLTLFLNILTTFHILCSQFETSSPSSKEPVRIHGLLDGRQSRIRIILITLQRELVVHSIVQEDCRVLVVLQCSRIGGRFVVCGLYPAIGGFDPLIHSRSDVLRHRMGIIVANSREPGDIVLHPHVVTGLWRHADGVPSSGDGLFGDEIRHRLKCEGKDKARVQNSLGQNVFLPLCIVIIVEGLASCGGKIGESHALGLLADFREVVPHVTIPG
jgi:hypothetical protein